MSSGGTVAKWIVKWLLQIPVYLVTSYLIRTLIGSCYRLLVRAGASLPPNYLLEHFLVVGAVGGLLAGFAGLAVFRAAMLLPQKPLVSSGPSWKRPQVWTWVLPFCIFLFGVMSWVADHAHHSVLAGSGGVGTSTVFSVFFGSGCYLPNLRANQWVYWNCMQQLSFTHAFVGTLAYSASAMIPSDWLIRFCRLGPASNECDPTVEESSKQDEHGQVAHS